MNLVITARELMDRHLWDRACELTDMNPWVVNEGQMDMDDEVSLPGDVVAELGLLTPGVLINAPSDSEHEHHHSGQVLYHRHPAGDQDHGYYEHPEDAR